MRVSIFGLGYVGCVSAACLADQGHDIVGVDVSDEKVATLSAGRSPLVEPGLDDLIACNARAGRLRATTDVQKAVLDTDVSVVCVGTPSTDAGALDLSAVRRVCEQIGDATRAKPGRHTVVLRSTMLPGSTETIAIPALERSSRRKAGVDFGVAYNPEFLREGTALRDFLEPPRTVIGEHDTASGDTVAALYASLQAPIVRAPISTAEMVKYADNAFHALKVAFANEIGTICKAMGVDGFAVMEIFVLDRKLNLAPSYLMPGYAFGGSCLPKDLRALVCRAAEMNVDVPMLRSVLTSNDRQKRLGYEMVRRAGSKKVGVFGLSFKADTDDLRESPAVELCETLIGKGYDVAVYDKNVALSRLIGSNLAYVQRELPHLASLLRGSIEEVLSHAETVVVTNRDPEFANLLSRLRSDQKVVDFARVLTDDQDFAGRYDGIAW